MTDVDELLAAFEAGELVRPSPEVPNLVDLANAVGSLVGVDGRAETPGAQHIAGLIGPSKRLVFVAADGLGMNLVGGMDPGAFMARHVALELRTVFPSSTPVVFTSLATGEWPSTHSVTGWHVYLREVDRVATIIGFVTRSDEKPLSELGLSPEQAYPYPTMAPGCGRELLSLLPEEIANQPFSSYTATGAPQQGFKTLHDAVDAVLARVASAGGTTFIRLYTPSIDTLAHEHGTGHEKVRDAVLELDREMARLAEGLPSDSRLIITADHGLLDAEDAQVHEIEPSDELIRCLEREPWGNGRAANFQVKEGASVEFEGLFRERYRTGFVLLSIEEIEQLELYGPGPMAPLTKARLGNYVAVSRGPEVIRYLAPKPERDDEDVRMASHHSGLSPDEMLVPLVVA